MGHMTKLLLSAVIFIGVGVSVSLARHMAWFVPVDLYLTAWHEAMHASAAWLTGGSVHDIDVHAGHGTTTTSGGIFPIISMAGYVGTALWGCTLLASLRVTALREPLKWLTLTVPCVVMLLGGGFGVSFLLVLAISIVVGVLWHRVGHWTGLGLSVVFASESFKDIQVYLVQSPYETDAGILANFLGLPLLTLPIALGLAGLTLVVWCLVLKWTILTKRATTSYTSFSGYQASTYDS